MSVSQTIYGISAFHHDAALAVVRDDEILFAAHAERYSRVKNDPDLNQKLIDDALERAGPPDVIYFYERPLLTRARHLRAGQWRYAFLPQSPERKIREFRGLEHAPVRFTSHHCSHAAGGFYTSAFDEATIVVADGIGELDTLTVWHGRGVELTCHLRARYPHSLGLLYSAFTQRVGFKPNEEEFIVMALAAFGQARHRELILREFISGRPPHLRLRKSVHRGIDDWHQELTSRQDLAASMQAVTEEWMLDLIEWALKKTGCPNLVFSGGVALNCRLNDRIARLPELERMWVMPNPGDAGSSLGAILAGIRRKVIWRGPYLGHEICRIPDIGAALQALTSGRIIGMASGRAEFGPRALGNRSLLADPRSLATKGRVNEIKQRERFRPFAPVVLAEHAPSLFDIPKGDTSYMQYAVPCRDPGKLAAVVHIDSSSRVQTVSRSQNKVLYELIEAFHQATRCPVLLNTSLNVKGEPLVNRWEEARAFSEKHDVPVF